MVVYFMSFPLHKCVAFPSFSGVYKSSGKSPKKTPTRRGKPWSRRQSVFLYGSIGQSFSALCASSFQNISAVGGFHSLSETVFLFSLTLFRLVSSQHRIAPPLTMIGNKHGTRFYTMTGYIITERPPFCQAFFQKKSETSLFFRVFLDKMPSK